MHSKEFKSFEAIDLELEILALEKELSYQKLMISYQKIYENIQPESIKNEVFGYIRGKVTESARELLVFAIPFVLKFFKKRKRGD